MTSFQRWKAELPLLQARHQFQRLQAEQLRLYQEASKLARITSAITAKADALERDIDRAFFPSESHL